MESQLHLPSLQFARRDIAWEFDADQDQARATRLRIMSLAAGNLDYVAGATSIRLASAACPAPETVFGSIRCKGADRAGRRGAHSQPTIMQ